MDLPLDVPEWSLSTDGCFCVFLAMFEAQRCSAPHQQICLFGTLKSFYFLSWVYGVLSGHFSTKGKRLKWKSHGGVDLEM